MRESADKDKDEAQLDLQNKLEEQKTHILELKGEICDLGQRILSHETKERKLAQEIETL